MLHISFPFQNILEKGWSLIIAKGQMISKQFLGLS
jgi:hypothetical protein